MLMSLAGLVLLATQDTPTLEAGRAALERQDFAAAATIFEALVAADDDDAQAWHGLGLALHRQKETDAALEAHLKAATFPSVRASASYHAACAHAVLGDPDRAIEWLERAYDAGFRDRGRCFTDADLSALASDPRFALAVPPLLVGDDAFAEDVRVLHEFHGENAGDQFGWVARSVGDLDGDGVTDFATTAPSWPGDGRWLGKVYVYSRASSCSPPRAPPERGSATASRPPATSTGTATPTCWPALRVGASSPAQRGSTPGSMGPRSSSSALVRPATSSA